MIETLFISGVKVIIFRDDLYHPTVSGNKLHKLSPNIELAQARNCSAMLSFGGPYSNHLHALAFACKEQGLASIGIIRGELHKNLTPTLNDCKEWGMRLVACQRKEYRRFCESLSSLKQPCLDSETGLPTFSDLPTSTLVLPEGGSNFIAIQSVADAYRRIFCLNDCQSVTHAVCAVGTGATVAGLRLAAPSNIEVIGIQAVAEAGATLKRINNWMGENSKTLKIRKGHLGGFAKITPELLAFINRLEAQHNIPLDPVYTGKALFKISKMISAGEFTQSDTILFVHTGGIQGKRSQHKT